MYDLRMFLMMVAILSGSPATSDSAVTIGTGELELSIVDAETGNEVVARMSLTNARGRTIRPRNSTKLANEFMVDGKILLTLAEGDYHFVIERGLEYRTIRGAFNIRREATDNKTVALVRFVDMSSEGWWSGDFSLRRSAFDAPLFVVGEDLHLAHLVNWDNQTTLSSAKEPPDQLWQTVDGDRYLHLINGFDSRSGGGLLLLNFSEPANLTQLQADYPSSVDVIKTLRLRHDSMTPTDEAGLDAAARTTTRPVIVAASAVEWDLPVWLAGGLIDAIGLAPQWYERKRMMLPRVGAKPVDADRFLGPTAAGQWNEAVYYHVLNCGFRMPPCGYSGAGKSLNPAGYNRTYAYCGDDFSPGNWFDAFAAGQVMVTNGPMLRPRVNDQLPGYVFASQDGSPIELEIALKLSTREKVDYLEIVKNGQVVENVMLNKWVEAGGKLPKIRFEESGWLLVRAVTNNQETYRFATSAPYYVEVGSQTRISRASAQFFLDWVYERAKQITLDDPRQQSDVMRYHRAARDFWQKRVDAANAP